MPSRSLREVKRDAASKLSAYTDPTNEFAFATYDHLYGYDGPLTPADVLLTNLLSLRLTWRQVIPLFKAGDEPPQQLRATLDTALLDLEDAPSFEDHDDLEHLERSLAPLAAANEAAQLVRDWTEVTVSKVLHRRRPHIVPLIDSRVRTFYGARKPRAIRAAMWADLKENRDWLTAAADRHRTPDGRRMTLLRAADILIWMA